MNEQELRALIRGIAAERLSEHRHVHVIGLEPLRLDVGREGPTDVRTLVPLQVQPAQTVEDRFGSAGDEAVLVGILDAHDKAAAGVLGQQPVEQRRADVADVGHAGRAGSVADPDRHDGVSLHEFSTYKKAGVARPPSLSLGNSGVAPG